MIFVKQCQNQTVAAAEKLQELILIAVYLNMTEEPTKFPQKKCLQI